MASPRSADEPRRRRRRVDQAASPEALRRRRRVDEAASPEALRRRRVDQAPTPEAPRRRRRRVDEAASPEAPRRRRVDQASTPEAPRRRRRRVDEAASPEAPRRRRVDQSASPEAPRRRRVDEAPTPEAPRRRRVDEAPTPEALRRRLTRETPRQRKRELGQFMTPEPVARFMASLFRRAEGPLALLEPSAGLGALATAVLDRWRGGGLGGGAIRLTAHELDERLRPHLARALAPYAGRRAGLRVIGGDFLAHAVAAIEAGRREHTHAILNPPYMKIAVESDARRLCRRAGLETVNLYAAFVGLALAQLAPGGQLVALIPRSFCNGPYYRPFRRFLLERAAIRRIHLFEARDHAFRDDGVLQENVILVVERDAAQGRVTISTSRDARLEDVRAREVDAREIVRPGDAHQFIHVPSTARDPLARARGVRHALADLGLSVSTGPVVDFRLRAHLSQRPARHTVPLLYPAHVAGRAMTWPLPDGKRPNAIARNAETERWLFPAGTYAVVRRFSAKEEPRRVVASLVSTDALPGAAAIGFENHLNVFHQDKGGLPREVAWGLCAYLNCTAVDERVRRFNGHTQINATDLRALPYPSLPALRALGRWAARTPTATQAEIDRRVAPLLER